MAAVPALYLQEAAGWTQQEFSVRVPDNVSYEQLQELLAQRLATLINQDFGQFVQLLYRIDVAENKVRLILQDAAISGEEPYKAVAALIIDRQLQKIASRAAFKQQDLPDDEERW
ncbi:hypothetical protein [Chitinophaga nivalis]|uniref:Uncharacterized protein n=1 Tax=Chitinophaga nivalis TaxID=2991709 RepID=A0ABT3IUH4_9BACT|nr:hypothetical protein [Chitinophaga nivalis]MCW3462677.1 hypothetical protein [Chitinophaga nivalis]MCW3487632.1 hypothetical protein [Chitinophaga nivalis]